jgi:hypothetical protein
LFTLIPPAVLARTLSAVAPLRLASHDRAMHLGEVPADLATRAPHWLWKQSEIAVVDAPTCGDITSRCSGTGIDVVHARHGHASIMLSVRAPHGWRPPAELGR